MRSESERAALHLLLLSPEVGAQRTTSENKGPASEVINPGPRGKERGVKMTSGGERGEQRAALKVAHTGCSGSRKHASSVGTPPRAPTDEPARL